jgi:heptosyltransferase-2
LIKILIIAPSWVGDTVMSQPLFMRLKQRDPQPILDVFAPAWVAPILRRMPEVDEVITNPFAHGELRLLVRWRLARALARHGYSQVIVLPNSLKSALIPFFAGIPRRTGFVGEKRYGLLNDARQLDAAAYPLMVERFALLAQDAGEPLARPLPNPRLLVNDEHRVAVLARLDIDHRQPAVALCPGAEYGPAKRWPEAHFAALARSLAARGYAVWLVGSHKDRAIGERIAAASGGATRNLCGQTSLDQAVDLLASAVAVVTNDSGLMHVAAALDRPMVALYGSSSPGFTPPLSAAARIASLNLPCSPCFQRECPLGHLDCLRKLSPEQVMDLLEPMLPGAPGRAAAS